MASGDTNVTNLVASGTISAGGDTVFATDTQVGSADGAITVKNGTVVLTKAGVAAMTLAAPTATTDDYKVLTIVAATANAHTVTQTTPGFNNGGAASDVATFGGAVGDNMVVMAYQGVWHVLNLRNVTLA